MAFLDSKSTVWAATSDCKLEQYCCETGTLLAMIDTGHRDEIAMLLVHPSGNLLMCGGHDRILRVWDCSKCVSPFSSVTIHLKMVLHRLGTRTSHLPPIPQVVKCILLWSMLHECNAVIPSELHPHVLKMIVYTYI
jgi:WD40 repeat protein